MDKLLKPSVFVLIVFGIIIILPISYLNYMLSFMWFPPFEVYVILLYILIALLLIVSYVIDRKINSNLIKYIYIIFAMFTLVLLLSVPIKNWQIKESENIGNKIVDSIMAYKENNKKYPDSLTMLTEKYIDLIPKSKIGTEYKYELSHDTTNFTLSFLSYNGMVGYYNHEKQKWQYSD